MPRVRRMTHAVPSISSRSVMLEMNDYSDGMDSYVSNDKFDVKNGGSNMWRLAQDARITTLGEYGTRKGFDYLSDSAGVTLDASQVSITGQADQKLSQTTWLAQQFAPASGGRLTRLDVQLKNTNGGTGTPLFEIWTDASSAPGTVIATSSVASAAVSSSYTYLTVRFPEPPLVTPSTSYWIVAHIQPNATNDYLWSSTTAASTAKTSTDSGVSWTAQNFALNFRQYYATDGGSKGFFRGVKSDGTLLTVEAHGTTLYSVNNVTGAKTAIKTGLSSTASDYHFELKNDVLYYVNGFDGYRKWDGTTESQINSTNYTLLTHHKGMMFLVRKDDPNKIDFSKFADYENFVSTDFIYVPAPKAGDPVTALNSLNGYLDIHTMDNNFILSGDDDATFRLDEAPDQNGTYSQQTITQDDSYMYYLSASGVYRSNGSEAQLLSTHAYQAVQDLNKNGAVLAVNKHRLYLWFKSKGSAYNDSCYVWNLSYQSGNTPTLESYDTDAFVSRAATSPVDDYALIVASSIVGALYWQELPSNDYTNLGGNINWELDNHYNTYGSPAVTKQITYWEPRFKAQASDYTVSCEYAYDQRNNWQNASDIPVKGSGPVWGSFVWGQATWGTSAETTVPTPLYIPGDHRRIATRYKHHATRQPNTFLGHTLGAQVRRLR